VSLDVAQRVADSDEFPRLDRLVDRSANDARRRAKLRMTLRHTIQKSIVGCAASNGDHASGPAAQTPDELRRRRARRPNVGVGMTERVGMLERRAPRDPRRIARNDRSRRTGKE
jgi:hypothetical protein